MKLLLATDGSAGASIAEDLVIGLPWPDHTTVDVVRVVDTMLSTWAYAPVPNLEEPHELLMSEARSSVDRTVAHLRGHGLGADVHLPGRTRTVVGPAAGTGQHPALPRPCQRPPRGEFTAIVVARRACRERPFSSPSPSPTTSPTASSDRERRS